MSAAYKTCAAGSGFASLGRECEWYGDFFFFFSYNSVLLSTANIETGLF